jgi:predicted ATPase/class 3 adenylate cyclase
MTDALSVTVTFLFTDIEGSSRMWELDPAAMDAALHLHNRVVANALHAHRGKIFKSMGDAFCCAFEDAADATRAAIATQIELGKETWPESTGPLRVRIGLHTGAAIHDEGDYFGPALNRVARIMSSAHGGQIVVSSATFAVLGAPQDGIAFRDLGVKRLKDLEQPEHLYQLVAEGLVTQFPPLRTLDEHPNNLPTQLSSFVGRRAELDRLTAAFDTSRVVTIAGPGGIGKTRLALQFAAESAHRFPGGAFFVELANVTDPVLVPHTVAGALGLAENGAEKPVETIARFVGDKTMLLIVDNSEHLLAEVATLVKTLASSCANLSVLVTSREPLHLMGERVERLAAMSLPEHVDASELETTDGCRLFLERARAAGTDFSLLQQQAEAVVSICRRLGGIPLAIEIAASRTATLSPKKLAERLDAHLLVNKDPTATERHRTLAKAIEWSYRLLDDSEKRAFIAMSVFRGGWTADALSAVVGFDAVAELESLLDKSLVHQASITDEEEPRYRFSDPTREFAIIERPSLPDVDLDRRHFDFFARRISRQDEAVETCYRRISLDLDNIRAALEWSLGATPTLGAQLALSLSSYWRTRSNFTEARLWFDRARSSTAVERATHADLTRHYAAFSAMQDDYESAELGAREALAIYGDLADHRGIGAALHTLAEVEHRKGNLECADELYGDALTHLTSAGFALGIIYCLSNRGLLARQRGDFALAESLLKEASQQAASQGDSNASAQIMIERAWLSIYREEPDLAEASFLEAARIKDVEGDAHGSCQARLGLGTALLAEGRYMESRQVFEETLRDAHRLGARLFVIDSVFGISAALAGLREFKAASASYVLAQSAFSDMKPPRQKHFAREVAEKLISEGLNQEIAEWSRYEALESYRDPATTLSQIEATLGTN